MMKKPRFELKPFQAGQIWDVDGVSLRIDMVGKTLVQYKRFKGKPRGMPASLATKPELEKYLTEHKAILARQ
jgi:hypothetical protein